MDLSCEDKLLTLYLLASPHANMLGCYRLPLAYAAEDLKPIPFETLSEGFKKLVRKGFIQRDETLAWTLIPNHLKWNPIDGPNQGKAIAKLVAAVPRETSVYAGLVNALRKYGANLPEGFVDTLETVPEPFRNQKQEQISNEKQEQVAPQSGGDLPLVSAGLSKGEAERDIIKALFLVYCEGLGRSAKKYRLTDDRRRKALSRLRERLEVHDGDLYAASQDLGKAVENLVASKWHREQGHIDLLAQIFKSQEEFEKRLIWEAPREDANGKDCQHRGALARHDSDVTAIAEATAELRASFGLDGPAQGQLPEPGNFAGNCQDLDGPMANICI
jgi:hypothetical protein